MASSKQHLYLILLAAGCTPGTTPVSDDTGPTGRLAVTAPVGGWTTARSFSMALRAGNALSPASIIVQADRLWFTSAHSPAVGTVDLTAGVMDRVYDLDEPPGSSLLAVDHGQRWIFRAEPGGDTLTRITLASGHVDTIDLGLDEIDALAWDPVTARLLAAGARGRDHVLWSVDEEGGDGDWTAVDVQPTSIALDAPARRVALGGRADGGGLLIELDADDLTERARWEMETPVGSITPEPDAWVFSAKEDILRTVGTDVELVGSPGDAIMGLESDSTGSLWALRMKVGYDHETGMTIGRLYHYDDDVLTLAVDARGGPRRLDTARPTAAVATPSGDTSEILLTAFDGRQQRIPTGHSPSVVRASPADPGTIAIVDRLGGEVQVRQGPHLLVRWQTDGWPFELTWDADGGAVYVYENGRDAVTRLDIDTGDATVIFDDSRTTSALRFGAITRDDDVLYVGTGGLGLVRALTVDGDLLWETRVAAAVERTEPDRVDRLSVGVDGRGRIWALDTLDSTYSVLDSDGVELTSASLPGSVDNDTLFVDGERIYIGPYAADPDTLELDPTPAFDGERVLAIVGDTLLIDDDDGFGFEGGPIFDHSERIYGGSYRAIWDPGTGGVWLSRFATAEVDLVLPVSE